MKEVFVDLDALINDEITFKLHGKTYALKNLDVKTFMNFANEVSHVQDLYKKQEVSSEEVLKTYVDLIHSLCDDFNEDVAQTMTHSQIAALLQLCLDFTQGKVHSNKDVEKKSL